MNQLHEPKGGMCIECANSASNCSSLDFKSMVTIGWYTDLTNERVAIVRCSEYARRDNNDPDGTDY